MSVRKLRAKQKGPWCSYCDKRAVYRGCHFKRFSCHDHLYDLEEEDREQTKQDSRQTEAEWILGV